MLQLVNKTDIVRSSALWIIVVYTRFYESKNTHVLLWWISTQNVQIPTNVDALTFFERTYTYFHVRYIVLDKTIYVSYRHRWW